MAQLGVDVFIAKMPLRISKDKIQDTAKDLPEDAITYIIKGGNHEQFGYYGHQKGDGVPLLTREEQHSVVVEQIMNFIGLE